MFSNLNWYNVVVLLLVALFVFGDKLPQLIADGLRMLRNLRRMAQSATTDLSRELGTEVRLEDLNPRTFVRRHVLSEEDQQKLIQPLRSASDDLVAQTKGVHDDLDEVTGRANGAAREARDATSARRRTRAGNRPASRASASSRAPAAREDTDSAAAGAASPAAGDASTGAPEPDSGQQQPTRRYDDVL